jgi:hypothetical protein
MVQSGETRTNAPDETKLAESEAAMSTVDNLLERLDKVKQTGEGRWTARCPAHNDQGPSLAIRELDDGRILLHCFAGCSIEEVLSAIGLTFDDLFPPREIEHGRLERRPFPAADILRCIAFEALIVASSGVTLLDGKPFSETDRERLVEAVSRIQSALTAGGLSYE